MDHQCATALRERPGLIDFLPLIRRVGRHHRASVGQRLHGSLVERRTYSPAYFADAKGRLMRPITLPWRNWLLGFGEASEEEVARQLLALPRPDDVKCIVVIWKQHRHWWGAWGWTHFCVYKLPLEETPSMLAARIIASCEAERRATRERLEEIDRDSRDRLERAALEELAR